MLQKGPEIGQSPDLRFSSAERALLGCPWWRFGLIGLQKLPKCPPLGPLCGEVGSTHCAQTGEMGTHCAQTAQWAQNGIYWKFGWQHAFHLPKNVHKSVRTSSYDGGLDRCEDLKCYEGIPR